MATLANASFVSTNEIVCMAPSGVYAGVTKSIGANFDQNTPLLGSTLYGDAMIQGGHVLLTGKAMNQMGSFVMDVMSDGVDGSLDLGQEQEVSWFDAQFDVGMWGGDLGMT